MPKAKREVPTQAGVRHGGPIDGAEGDNGLSTNRSAAKTLLAGFTALFLLVVLAYHAVPGCGFVGWDDAGLLTGNANLRSVAGLARCWTDPQANIDYYPLTFTSWWIEVQLWGLKSAAVYHIDNVLLHAMNAMVLWLILRRLGVRGAWVIAAAWAVHPVQVESVAWVSQRKNVLSGLFFFLSAWCFVRGCLGESSGLAWEVTAHPAGVPHKGHSSGPGPSELTPHPAGVPHKGHSSGPGPSELTPHPAGVPATLPHKGGGGGGSFEVPGNIAATGEPRSLSQPQVRWLYGLSLVLFVAAMFAKPVTMTLAGILPLLVWWKRGRIRRADVALLTPYLLLAVPMALLTLWVQRYTVKAVGWEFEQSFMERVIIAGRVVWFYAGKLAWPAGLCFAYPKWTIDAGGWTSYLPVLATVIVVAVLWFGRRRLGRAPLAAVLVFIIALSPALGFFRIYWHRYYFVADHVQYLASAALIALAVGSVAHYVSRFGVIARRGAAGVAGAGLLVLAFLSSCQVPAYHDADSLWQATLADNPQCWIAYNNMGMELMDRGQRDGAIALYRKALDLNPRLYEAHYNLGIALSHYGQTVAQLPGAIAQFRQAIEGNPSDGHYYNALGNALTQAGRPREAVAEFDKAIALTAANPTTQEETAVAASAHYQKGKALAALGQTDGAMEEMRWAIRLNADDSMVHDDLGVLLGQAGRIEEAAVEFRAAVRLVPEDRTAQANLARALLLLRNRSDQNAGQAN